MELESEPKHTSPTAAGDLQGHSSILLGGSKSGIFFISHWGTICFSCVSHDWPGTMPSSRQQNKSRSINCLKNLCRWVTKTQLKILPCKKILRATSAESRIFTSDGISCFFPNARKQCRTIIWVVKSMLSSSELFICKVSHCPATRQVKVGVFQNNIYLSIL